MSGQGAALLPGFRCHKQSEALEGVLPVGRNSPQRVAHELYAEKLSGTAFTAPRAQALRTWLYRIRPSVVQRQFSPLDHSRLRSAPDAEGVMTPNQLRWGAFDPAATEGDFLDGLVTLATTGSALGQTGIAVHRYTATRSMTHRFFYNADGELLIVPQTGTLTAHTECGVLEVPVGHILLIPRGMKFRIAVETASCGFICENYGAAFQLPERGPIGTDGLANDRDFESPVAAYEDREGEFELVAKFGGKLFSAPIGHSPLDVVAWHGNDAPYRYDLERFNTMGSISYDHPDPSIFTVLTSPSDTLGTANCDFVIFPPRWLVMEDTFRPPWYHRNVMSEFMGLLYGEYDAKAASGFGPGGSSLHNCMSGHGPDTKSYRTGTTTALAPQKLDHTMAFMFESRTILVPTEFAMRAPELHADYADCWQDLPRGLES
ncbi:MAG: homogentisate 1,2-dioxygenase [Pseudomonadota bacterium]